MIKGQSLGDVWLDLAILLGFTALFFIIESKDLIEIFKEVKRCLNIINY